MLFKKKDRMTRDAASADISGIQEKYGLRIATIVADNDWVKAKAREIDLDRELHLAKDLDRIMRHMKDLYKFVGVSSNNIYWNLTQSTDQADTHSDDGKKIYLPNKPGNPEAGRAGE